MEVSESLPYGEAGLAIGVESGVWEVNREGNTKRTFWRLCPKTRSCERRGSLDDGLS